uniref:Uncharacterized protein n=1 Tax=Amphimedon queenslandica TaxID=400682 RepID=A0A1X7VIW0_AMPQE
MATGRKVLLSLKSKKKPVETRREREGGREREQKERDKLPDNRKSLLSLDSRKLFYKFISKKETTQLPATNLLYTISSSSSSSTWSPLPPPNIKRLTQSHNIPSNESVQDSPWTNRSSCSSIGSEEEEVRYKERGRNSSSSGIVSCKRSVDRQTTLDGSIAMNSSNKRSHCYKKKTSSFSFTATNNKSFTSGTTHSSFVPESFTTNTRDNGCHGNSRHGSSSDDAIRI